MARKNQQAEEKKPTYEVTGNGESFSCDEKRFYAPFVIRTKCPECGVDHEHDCSDWYFSYPTFNEQFDLNMACRECDHNWLVPVRLDLSLTVL